MSKARDLADSVAAGSVLADGVVSLSEVGGGTNNGVVYVNGTGTTTSGSGLTFDGANLGVAGTVDGRDVAADGSKLDGIEAGATADQTASEIKTAYESNANTNAFTDAEQSKLSGIEAGADVTDTANVTAAGAVMNVEPVRHSVRPSLLLDFANTKTLDPRITFTRPTSATYYDGVTTAKAEENLLVYSEVFGNDNWTKTSVGVSSDATTAPNGSATAELLVPSTSTTGKHIYQQATLESGSAYTLSIFVKAGGYNFVQLTPSNGFPNTTDYVNFNLSTGAIGNTAGTLSPVIQSVGDSWYRVSITATANTTTGRMLIVPLDSDTASRLPSYAGDGTSGIYVWGAQMEQRSSVTAYTPITTQRITNYIPVLKTAAGGQARFDHNPTTGESLGLLIEEQRTNLVVGSTDFSGWTRPNVSYSVEAVAPDGTLSASKFISTTTGSNSGAYRAIAGTATTISMYAKAAGKNWLAFINTSGSAFIAFFNVSTGVVGTVATGYTASITAVGNGWYRCVLTAASGSFAFHQWCVCDQDNDTSVTSNQINGVCVWGAQAEAGSFATSYIPTTSAQVTRSADSASMTGTNFSSWYNQGEGTAYAEAQINFAPIGGGGAQFYSIDNGSTNIIQPYFSNASGILFTYITVNSVMQANTGVTVIQQGQMFKHTQAYQANNFASVVDNGTVSADASGIVPTVTQIRFTYGVKSTYFKKFAYYPKRLTNAELQGLTS